MTCPHCGIEVTLAAPCCPSCGGLLPGASLTNEHPRAGTASATPSPLSGVRLRPAVTPPSIADSERKQITALFADLSGYTALADRLDPEDVKDITTRVLADIAEVIAKYQGFVEKYVGDAVLALFGIPSAHEDDAYRAVRAAVEIRQCVNAAARTLPALRDMPLQAHTGIQSGLVVTGHVDLQGGTHGVTGDALNVASRLSSAAGPDEILVGDRVRRLTEAQVEYQALSPITVKGKADPVLVHRVVAVREQHSALHRVTGRRAKLVGRNSEMHILSQKVGQLLEGQGTILTVSGEAGTGKSRLLLELKATLNQEQVDWQEGHAYPYTQSTAYSSFIDLLSRWWSITESDGSDEVARKVRTNVVSLVDDPGTVAPYIGALYSIESPQLAGLGPDLGRRRIHDAFCMLLAAHARRRPTILVLEDLHWADASSVELLRTLLSAVTEPLLAICTFRPSFNAEHILPDEATGSRHFNLPLRDLSPDQAADLAESLLQTTRIPAALREFLTSKAEGNPFFLEELVNALVDAGTLVRRDAAWALTRPLEAVELPATVHGVITSRIDRLDPELKRVLQEASVIGRVFSQQLLMRTSSLGAETPQALHALAALGVIQEQTAGPHPEWAFRHALTQEAVYGALLRRERREAHSRIARAIEHAYRDRIDDFVETLAHHYQESNDLPKAVDFLVRSGQKSWRRYALDEAHLHFQHAYAILSESRPRSSSDDRQLVRLLNTWALVFNHRGDYRQLSQLLAQHEHLASSGQRDAQLALMLGWLGYALQCHEQLTPSYDYLKRALTLADDAQDRQVLAYIHAWLTRTCADMGRLGEAVRHGSRAVADLPSFPDDGILFRFTMSALGLTHYFRGDVHAIETVATAVLERGHRTDDVRTTALGLVNAGCARMASGELSAAADYFQRASTMAVDPMYTHYAKLMLGVSLAAADRLHDAEGPLTEVIAYNERFGFELLGTTARGMLGIVLLSRGRLAGGVRIAHEVLERYLANGNLYRFALQQHLLGRIYLKLVQRSGPRGVSYVVRNLPFLIRNLPRAKRMAEHHLRTAIARAEAIEAKGLQGQAHLDLGRLYALSHQPILASESLLAARSLFHECGATGYVQEVDRSLASLPLPSPAQGREPSPSRAAISS